MQQSQAHTPSALSEPSTAETMFLGAPPVDRLTDVLGRVEAGSLSVADASRLLGVHRSTLARKLARLRAEGASGLRHGLAGRPSNRRLADDTKRTILALFRRSARDGRVAVAAFHRSLVGTVGVNASYTTLTQWLREEGLTAAPTRRIRRVRGQTVVVCRVREAVVIVDRADDQVLASGAGAALGAIKNAVTTMVERVGLPARLVVDPALAAELLPLQRRALRSMCAKLGMSLGWEHRRPFLPPSETRPVVSPDADSGVFVMPADNRWREIVSRVTGA